MFEIHTSARGCLCFVYVLVLRSTSLMTTISAATLGFQKGKLHASERFLCPGALKVRGALLGFKCARGEVSGEPIIDNHCELIAKSHHATNRGSLPLL